MVEVDIKIGLHTDHSLITLIIDRDEEKRGPGWWKLNTTLLNDDEFKKVVKGIIKDGKEDNGLLDSAVLWDYIKYKIKSFSIQYSKKKCLNMKKEEQTRL